MTCEAIGCREERAITVGVIGSRLLQDVELCRACAQKAVSDAGVMVLREGAPVRVGGAA